MGERTQAGHPGKQIESSNDKFNSTPFERSQIVMHEPARMDRFGKGVEHLKKGLSTSRFKSPWSVATEHAHAAEPSEAQKVQGKKPAIASVPRGAASGAELKPVLGAPPEQKLAARMPAIANRDMVKQVATKTAGAARGAELKPALGAPSEQKLAARMPAIANRDMAKQVATKTAGAAAPGVIAAKLAIVKGAQSSSSSPTLAAQKLEERSPVPLKTMHVNSTGQRSTRIVPTA